MSERLQGYFKARGVAGSDQHGNAANGSEQIAIDLDVQVTPTETRRMTTILSFSGRAVPYSIERLEALGWDRSADLPMRGLDRNEVDVEIKWERNPTTGEEQQRVEIKTTAGRFTFKAPMSDMQKRGFMAKLAETAKQQAHASANPGEWPPPPAPNGGARPKL